MTKILITGGAGYVGQALVARLLAAPSVAVCENDGVVRDVTVDEIVCLDVAEGALRDPRVRYQVGDVSQSQTWEACLDARTSIIFHLAAVVSGSAEADLELGQRVNLDGFRHLLARCVTLGHQPMIIFSSSIAVFGVGMPAIVTDDTVPMPLLSYGAQKLCAEILLQDHVRRGLVRGGSLRLPAVIARPGSPNGAATGFSSAVWREPLAARPYALPVPRETRMWCASPRTISASLSHALSLTPAKWAPWPALNLPGRSLSMQDCIDALERATGLGHTVGESLDPVITGMSKTWACEFETPRALALGFPRDDDADAMLRAYIEDHPADIHVPVR